jgi:beta-glucosidase
MNQFQEKIKTLPHPPLPKRSKEEIRELTDRLLEKMTLREKIGQLFQTAPDDAHIEGLRFDDSHNTVQYIKEGLCGSILGVHTPNNAYQLQRIAVEESRLGIPLFFGLDIIHGCRTIFPINLAMSCSFDPELIEKASAVAAAESAHTGINITYSPMADVVRDPRWGRVMESSGEDPYLGRSLGRAYIRGYQQGNLSGDNSIGACVKHFAGYGAVEAGREYNTVDMSDRQLRMYHLPAYQSCVDEDCAAVMASFNIINGVPSTCSRYLLTDILRNEWHYEGFVISDYTSTSEIMNHKITTEEKEVAKLCLNAGLDHEMVSNHYITCLEELVSENEVSLETIEASCRRILTFKYKLGLFDDPYKNVYDDPEQYMQLPQYREIALEIAKRSIVLLKNEKQVLPLSKDKKIALIGPAAITNRVAGGWGGLGRIEECISFYTGMQNHGYQVVAHEGCSFEGSDEDDRFIEEACELARDAEVILLAIGEPDYLTGEWSSRSELCLTGRQLELAARLKELDKPMVGVIFTGRPLDLTWCASNLDGLILGWYLGNETGNALASVISGDYNPSGKLTMSFPRRVGQIPVYYNQLPTGRPSLTGGPRDLFKSCYTDIPNSPLYPFGYGLSYSTFSYGNFHLSTDCITGEEEAVASADITNTGRYPGRIVTQLYIEAESFSVSRPVKELKGFEHTCLEPGETKTVRFVIARDTLAYLNIDNRMTPENRTYRIYIGGDSTTKDYQLLKFKE